MIRTFVFASLAAVMIAGPAFAGATCTNAPKSEWASKTKLESMLKGQGYDVRAIKTENGCYEVYATKNGSKANMAFNAKTFEQVANPEAGEN